MMGGFQFCGNCGTQKIEIPQAEQPQVEVSQSYAEQPQVEMKQPQEEKTQQEIQRVPTGNIATDSVAYNLSVNKIEFVLTAKSQVERGVEAVVVPNSRFKAPSLDVFKYAEDNGVQIVKRPYKNTQAWYVVKGQ